MFFTIKAVDQFNTFFKSHVLEDLSNMYTFQE